MSAAQVLVGVAGALAYPAVGVLTARVVFRHRLGDRSRTMHGLDSDAYTDACFWATVLGLLWPVFWAVMGVLAVLWLPVRTAARFVTSETPDERVARLADEERERDVESARLAEEFELPAAHDAPVERHHGPSDVPCDGLCRRGEHPRGELPPAYLTREAV